MGTTIRPEISKKNPYWIERHRYYELKHFCLQYRIWKKAYDSLDGMSKHKPDSFIFANTNVKSDPTAQCVIAKEFYRKRMEMIEQSAIAADPYLATYILEGVTEGHSYEYLSTVKDIPCCKDTYYDVYRRFFWHLSRVRN